MNTVERLNFLLLLKTLADEQRLKMVGLMTNQERNVGELAQLLQLSEPTVSHHLSKMHSAGREVMFVNPAYTSKTCSHCGAHFDHLTLAERWVECSCGLSLDHDHNAAINILKRTGWDASAGVNVECKSAHAWSGSLRL